MTREEYEKQYDAIDRDDNDDSGSISMYARRAHASNMRVNVCQDYISSLEARIDELEKKSMQCPRCGDPITNELGDNPICGPCALASELNVNTLQARIAELEKYRIEGVSLKTIKAVNESFRKKIAKLQAENAKLRASIVTWHKYPDEKPTELGRYVIHRRHNVMPPIDVRFWTGKDWRDRDVAYWAYMPEPPREEQ